MFKLGCQFLNVDMTDISPTVKLNVMKVTNQNYRPCHI